MEEWNSLYGRLTEIAHFVQSSPETNPYVKEKYAKLADPSIGQKIYRQLSYELKFGEMTIRPGNRVLDAGCGSGIYSVLFALNGAHVLSVDYDERTTKSLDQVVQEFSLPITVKKADLSKPDPVIRSWTADRIFCSEAISHFHDTLGFVSEASFVLQPGGKILIADWNNGANPWVRKEIYDMWERSEIGPFTIGTFPQNSNLPYVFRRWMIITNLCPDLSDEEVFQLGLRTSGVGGEELKQAILDYSDSRVMPDSTFARKNSVRQPERGQLNEEPLNPKTLVHMFKRLGVKSRALPYYGYGRSHLMPWANTIGRYLGYPALLLCRKYLVVGTKS